LLTSPRIVSKLPTVAFVLPNLLNDMHSGNPNTQIKHGDTWLHDHPRGDYLWTKDHDNLLIVTFDESGDGDKYMHLTSPRSDNPVIRNRVATVFAGARVKPGSYGEGTASTT
jgi:hypothetical protein